MGYSWLKGVSPAMVGASVTAAQDWWGASNLQRLCSEVHVLAANKDQGTNWSEGEGRYNWEQTQSLTSETCWN